MRHVLAYLVVGVCARSGHVRRTGCQQGSTRHLPIPTGGTKQRISNRPREAVIEATQRPGKRTKKTLAELLTGLAAAAPYPRELHHTHRTNQPFSVSYQKNKVYTQFAQSEAKAQPSSLYGTSGGAESPKCCGRSNGAAFCLDYVRGRRHARGITG